MLNKIIWKMMMMMMIYIILQLPKEGTQKIVTNLKKQIILNKII